MAFKLGSKKGNKDMKVNIGGTNRDMVSGVAVERVKLPQGTLGEAHKEGVIYINENIDPNSEQYRRVLNHEMKHMTHMKLGKVDYSEDYIYWNGTYYPRANGYIYFENKWHEEGSLEFPWEFKD